jgi:hypothetical protein
MIEARRAGEGFDATYSFGPSLARFEVAHFF